MSDGLLVDIDTGEWFAVAHAPIPPRYAAAAVWTGSEFIVIGGHSFDQSYIDGAAFNPVDLTWRVISSGPLSPAAHPSAIWTGSEVVVWLAGSDSEFAQLPSMGVGQIAAYHPSTDGWRILEAPDTQMIDASLSARDDGLVLVGGPTMRDLGTTGPTAHLEAITGNTNTGEWSDPVEGPVVESARPFQLEDGRTAALTDDGTIHVVDASGWDVLARVPEACWFDIGAASGGGTAYLKSCSTYLLDGTTAALILSKDDYGATSNTFGSAFLATQDGRLVTLSDAEPGEGTSGTAIFGVYHKSG